VFSHEAIAQVGKFGIVGILNTVLDFVIFNILSSKRVGMGKIPANICSTTVAMIFSFFANRTAVFEAGSGDPAKQAVLFFVVTGFGLYVLQSGVLYLLLRQWKWPAKLTTAFLKVTHLNKRFSTDFVLKNGAKVVATLVSLTWNFFMYKYVVFA
jgi:putative flippase GtrA